MNNLNTTETTRIPAAIFDEWSLADIGEAAWVLGSVIADIRHHNIADTAIEFLGIDDDPAKQIDELREIAERLIVTAGDVLAWCRNLEREAYDRGYLRQMTVEQLGVRYRFSSPGPPTFGGGSGGRPLAINHRERYYDRVMVEVERRGLNPDDLEDTDDG